MTEAEKKKTKIQRYDRCSDGTFQLAEEFSADTRYWRVENGRVFYIFWDVLRTVYIERSKIPMKMSEKEALADNCHCYYKVVRI